MVESLALHQAAAPQEVTPAARVSMIEAGVDAKPDHLIVVGMLRIGRGKRRNHDTASCQSLV